MPNTIFDRKTCQRQYLSALNKHHIFGSTAWIKLSWREYLKSAIHAFKTARES